MCSLLQECSVLPGFLEFADLIKHMQGEGQNTLSCQLKPQSLMGLMAGFLDGDPKNVWVKLEEVLA
jgi:hypothetical protein